MIIIFWSSNKLALFTAKYDQEIKSSWPVQIMLIILFGLSWKCYDLLQ